MARDFAEPYDYEIVAGITAETAAAASLQRSLTQPGIARSLHFLTAHYATAAH